MANAYATIAAGGWRNRPIAITQGDVPRRPRREPRPSRASTAPSPTASTHEATKILEQNVKAGTGYPNATAIGCPAAGKTGTTDNNTDAWFVGYTPHLATAVWVGHANSRVDDARHQPAARSRRRSGAST